MSEREAGRERWKETCEFGEFDMGDAFVECHKPATCVVTFMSGQRCYCDEHAARYGLLRAAHPEGGE